MPDESITLGTSLAGAGLLPLGLQDVDQVAGLLAGHSVVDWKRLAFRDLDHVDGFLRRVGLHHEEPADAMRLVYLHRRSLEYLDAHFEVALNPSVRAPDDVRDLLLMASRAGYAQADACMILKVMHIVHHVAGRELLYRLPVPINELFHRIETQVFDAMDGMRQAGVRVAEFAGSRKTPDSVITKLLCQPDSHAARVHDRLRFRVVTESLDDLLGALVYLTRSVLPFSYVLPGQSRNDLVDLDRTLAADPRTRSLVSLMQRSQWAEGHGGETNLFSGEGFRIINFVVDMPVRVDDLVGRLDGYNVVDGHVVFLLVEFQLLDRVTAERNASGENNHRLYKARQQVRVRQRLKGA